MLDPPTNNRPFADKRDKVGMDGFPKCFIYYFFENGQSTLKDYILSKKGRIVKRLTIKHYQKFPLQLGILHIFMDAYALPTLLSIQVSFITLSLKIFI